MLKRRRVCAIGVALGGLSEMARAQPLQRKARIGFLGGTSPDPSAQRNMLESFRQTLRAATSSPLATEP